MAMLSIPISNDISRLFQELPLDNIERDPSNHISLFYLGDDLPMSKILKIIPVVYDLTKKLKPFTISTSNYSCFPQSKEEIYPVICHIKSSELIDLRKEIKGLFNKAKIKYDDTFPDYQPHITLGYSKEKVKNEKFNKIEFAVSQIALYGGDTSDSKLFVNFPLTIAKKSAIDILSTNYLKCATRRLQ